jgi:hypothetical protein
MFHLKRRSLRGTGQHLQRRQTGSDFASRETVDSSKIFEQRRQTRHRIGETEDAGSVRFVYNFWRVNVLGIAFLGRNVNLIRLHLNNKETLLNQTAYLTGFGIINGMGSQD